ncbi:hypothetical protein PT974_11058 [Cladobotryum mycophilum]|uniref:Uncharacterized protein n=1 Tax=Cladobotryum mycophilum TaxID=491253 RepID=A0ABR0SBI5_9HYPO
MFLDSIFAYHIPLSKAISRNHYYLMLLISDQEIFILCFLAIISAFIVEELRYMWVKENASQLIVFTAGPTVGLFVGTYALCYFAYFFIITFCNQVLGIESGIASFILNFIIMTGLSSGVLYGFHMQRTGGRPFARVRR